MEIIFVLMWFAFLWFMHAIGEDGRRGFLLWAWGVMLLLTVASPFLPSY